jgi:GAF domain-containing protein
MQRRGRSGQPVKGPRTTRPKARKAPIRRASPANLQDKLDQLTRELDEARQRETATSEVLKIISASPGQLEPVFKDILENAVRICAAKFGVLYQCEEDALRTVSIHGAPQSFVEERRRNPIVRPGPDTTLGRALAAKQPIQIADILEELDYFDVRAAQLPKLAGARTVLAVPMVGETELMGAILIYRQEVRPFTDKQIELLTNFAAQAVIAIENARLLNELRQRTDDLRETLGQQTATSEVLGVISSSPGELKPVFQSMLENAVRICEASFGNLLLYENDAFRHVALHNAPQAWATEQQRDPVAPRRSARFLYHVAETKQVSHIADITAENPDEPIAKVAGARTLLIVPMLKESELIGAIAIYRQEVRPFTDKQIELVKNFAAQAVIAIENTRLLNELRQSLEQQTATSEVLRVISGSATDLRPVFETIAHNSVHLCGATYGAVFRFDGEMISFVAHHNLDQAAIDAVHQMFPMRPNTRSLVGHTILKRDLLHIADVAAEPNYISATQQALGIRTFLGVPMLRDGNPIGAIALYRREVGLFSDRQIDLVKAFADQAVIAIENARLLNDLNKLNQQLEQRVTDQVSEIERMGRLRRFLPPQVADLIVASGAEKQLESHRREITALFCDLRGFTGFSESSDPEDVMALLREYHAAIGEIVNNYGGTLERYAGDGVMVVFNDPIPVDNSALQAVLMAIDMRGAIGELIEKWRKLGHDIGFGIGIAHGFATLGTIGFEGRFDYAAIGTVSNVASRLCDEAKPGQVLISPRVLMAVEKEITVEPVGDFALKGIRRPLTAYNVLATKAAD